MRFCVNGEVVANDDKWLYNLFGIESICPREIRQALDANPEGEPFVLEINSPGGDVFAGFEIYSTLRATKCETVAEVQSLAASAASTLMLGCGTVRLSPVAQVMIHLPSGVTRGDAHDHEKTIKVLQSITESILNGYEIRSNGKATRDELRHLMEDETWLSASRAVELGLADEVIGAEQMSGYSQGFRNMAGTAFRNAAGGHDPAQLLAIYEDEVRSGKRPEVEGHPVTNLANCDPTGEEPDKHYEDSHWSDDARALLAVI